MRFPSVQGTNLAGEEYRLPDDFAGRLNLVFVAFHRSHQVLVESWGPLANDLAAIHGDLHPYVLPVLGHHNLVLRAFIDSAMRVDVSDPTYRERTIPLYVDKRRFSRALDIPSDNTVHAFLVDDDGEVVWRAEGPRTRDAAADLQETVARRLAEP